MPRINTDEKNKIYSKQNPCKSVANFLNQKGVKYE